MITKKKILVGATIIFAIITIISFILAWKSQPGTEWYLITIVSTVLFLFFTIICYVGIRVN